MLFQTRVARAATDIYTQFLRFMDVFTTNSPLSICTESFLKLCYIQEFENYEISWRKISLKGDIDRL